MRRLIILPLALMALFLLSGCAHYASGDINYAYRSGYDKGYEEGYETSSENGFGTGCDAGSAEGFYEAKTFACLTDGQVEKALDYAIEGEAWETFLDAYDSFVDNVYSDTDTREKLLEALIRVAVERDRTAEDEELLESAFGRYLYMMTIIKVANAPMFSPADIELQDTSRSTCFSAVGYDAEQEVLVVQFRESGSRYFYSEFPSSEWESFISAESLGKYYNAFIKGQFPSERLD